MTFPEEANSKATTSGLCRYVVANVATAEKFQFHVRERETSLLVGRLIAQTPFPPSLAPEGSRVNFVRRVLVPSFQTTRRLHGSRRGPQFLFAPCHSLRPESFLRGHARSLARSRGAPDIDRLRSLNSAINDCVHRPRGSRSNEYDERVAALGERAVHTDLWLIDWTPFHSTTLRRHRGPTTLPLPPLSIPPHE